jgi:hypothetical protein
MWGKGVIVEFVKYAAANSGLLIFWVFLVTFDE